MSSTTPRTGARRPLASGSLVSLSMAIAAWRVAHALEDLRLARRYKTDDPSVADFYQTSAIVEGIFIAMAVAAAVGITWLVARRAARAGTPSPTRALLAAALVGLLLGVGLHVSLRRLEIARCEARGQRWERSEVACVSW